MHNYLRGAEWRKWDLQVQPVKNDWLLNFNPENQKIIRRVDSFLREALNKGIQVIAITDHNFGGCIDIALSIVEEKNYDLIVLPGIELNASEGWHILVIFNPEWKNRNNFSTWNDTIRNFLTICKVNNPYEPYGNVPIGITTRELIEKIYNEDIGILFFSHCLGEKGFFKRGNNDSRKKIVLMSLECGFLFGFDIKKLDEKLEIENQIRKCLSDDSYKLNLPIICSSDAHDANQVGQFFTWIKADPTFEGLKQILYEPEGRVFIGDEPELLKRVRENKTKFIKSLRINQVQGYDERMGIWFKDIEIPLNPGFVTIIGNKGNGKSAITDILGLCGNSCNYNNFSFLKEERFLKDGLACHFEAEIVWESNETIKKNLSEKTNHNSPERVRYLPQSFFEYLTNSLETNEFEKTLENLVFSYLPEEEKLGKTSFSEVINDKKKRVQLNVERLKSELSKINETIIELEKKAHPDYKKQIKEKLNLKKKELEEHEKIKPKKITDPSKDPSLAEEKKRILKNIDSLRERLNAIEEEREEKEKQKNEVKINIESLNNLKTMVLDLKTKIDDFVDKHRDHFKKHGISIENIINYKFDIDTIDRKVNEYINIKDQTEYKINDMNKQILEIKEKKQALEKRLEEPLKIYQIYLDNLKNWEDKRNEILGNENKPETIKWYEKELNYINDNLFNDLKMKRAKRLKIVKEIYKNMKDILNIYDSIKQSVDNMIDNFKDILGDYQITIDASFRVRNDFYEDFFRYINQNVKGSFRGKHEGKRMLEEIMKKKNFDNWIDVKQYLDNIINYLEEDKRKEAKGEKRYIQDQILRKNKWLEFYNFLFSLDYIDIIYELKLGNKKLTQLSPGERGALLIVFYLLLDKSDVPLIIDQPEENLDNETVYKILTHFIKYAKKKRQLILVTHNPNLAIVGDADQIIFVHIDKVNQNVFHFESGAIENPVINKHASNILEGTLKAFDIRRLKYIRRK